MSGEKRRNIYLVLNELLANAVKHSSATKIDVNLEFQQMLIIEIADNGTGFLHDPVKSHGNGLKNIRKRLLLLGGNMEIQTNAGTKISISIPIS